MKGVSALSKRSTRRLVLLLALVGALVWLWSSRPARTESGLDLVGSQDFVEYWGAAQLLVGGKNPYDPAALLAVQKEVGFSGTEPVLMWNPPWTLVVVLPFAFAPFRWSVNAWLLCGLGLVLGSGFLLWDLFAPGDRRHWIGLLLAAGFAPGLLALSFGQITPWMLAGTVGFLWAVRNQRDVLAGVALSLLLVKPHASYLFLLAAVWWTLRSRRWGVLGGCFAALTVSGSLVSLLSPLVFRDYLVAVSEPPLKWATPTLGFWLRLVVGLDQLWLQYIPSLVGILALGFWLVRFHDKWHWSDVAPPLLLASCATAAYGWSYDQVLLLPVAVSLVARQSTSGRRHRLLAVGALLSAQLGLLLQQLLHIGDFLSVWYTPVLAGLYWSDARSHRRTRARKPAKEDAEPPRQASRTAG